MAGFIDGGRRILSHFVSGSPGFVAPYVHAGPARPPVRPVGASDEDPLFADDAVDLATLRQRAYNYRWAVQSPGVISLTAADPDFPVCVEIIAAVQRHLGAGYVPYGPSDLRRRRDQAVARLAAIPGVRCAVPEGTFVLRLSFATSRGILAEGLDRRVRSS